MTGLRGAEAGHAGGSSARAAGDGSTTPASQGSRALSRSATSDATVKPGPRRTVPGWRRGAANAVMHRRSHSGAHSGFTGAPRGSGGTVHMNGRRSTRPSGSASDEDSARDCKPAGFAVSTPSGEGAAGDGGFLSKLSRRRFPSPFSLSRICSIGRWRHGAGAPRAAVSAVSLGGKFQISSGQPWKLPTISRFYNGNAAPRYGTPTPTSALSKPQTIDRYRQTGSATLDALAAA